MMFYVIFAAIRCNKYVCTLTTYQGIAHQCINVNTQNNENTPFCFNSCHALVLDRCWLSYDSQVPLDPNLNPDDEIMTKTWMIARSVTVLFWV